VRGEPPIFWIFDETIFPAGYRLEQKTTKSGDHCHYNIHDVSDSALKKLLKSKRIEDFFVCDNGNHRPLQRADLPSPPPVPDAIVQP